MISKLANFAFVSARMSVDVIAHTFSFIFTKIKANFI